MVVFPFLRVDRPDLREQPQGVDAVLGPLVHRRQDERVDEVLEDDSLHGQVGIVDELADVGPGRDELRRLLADDIVRSLGRVQFLELTLELLPFPLEPGQAFFHQVYGIRP